jgi:hypothetical protein
MANYKKEKNSSQARIISRMFVIERLVDKARREERYELFTMFSAELSELCSCLDEDHLAIWQDFDSPPDRVVELIPDSPFPGEGSRRRFSQG